jgi:hypothetical protein
MQSYAVNRMESSVILFQRQKASNNLELPATLLAQRKKYLLADDIVANRANDLQ